MKIKLLTFSSTPNYGALLQTYALCEILKSWGHEVELLKVLLYRPSLKNMLRREEDKLGAVLKVNSGAGGTEGQDWASMLVRMYQRWCESRGYKVTITNWQDGDEAGIKTATMQVEGDFAYGYSPFGTCFSI